MSLEKVLMVLYGMCPGQGLNQRLCPLLNLSKFRPTQAFWSESGHQEDYTF